MTHLRVLSFLIINLLLVSCTHTLVYQQDAFQLTFKEPQRLRFSGKGIGVGIMMSSMGQMGVALGVAIDEGIGKDIERTADDSGLDLKVLISNELRSRLLEFHLTSIQSVNINRYAFKTYPGQGDLVTAELHIAYLLKSGEQVLIQYPKNVAESNKETLLTKEFNQIKSEPMAIKMMLLDAVKQNVILFTEYKKQEVR